MSNKIFIEYNYYYYYSEVTTLWCYTKRSIYYYYCYYGLFSGTTWVKPVSER